MKWPFSRRPRRRVTLNHIATLAESRERIACLSLLRAEEGPFTYERHNPLSKEELMARELRAREELLTSMLADARGELADTVEAELLLNLTGAMSSTLPLGRTYAQRERELQQKMLTADFLKKALRSSLRSNSDSIEELMLHAGYLAIDWITLRAERP